MRRRLIRSKRLNRVVQRQLDESALAEAVDHYDAGRLDLIEKELLRQRDRMSQRLSSSATRAAVLVGAAGVLSGTQLLTASGNTLWALFALGLYLTAAILGLFAMRPMRGGEVQVADLVRQATNASSLGVQRSILASNIVAHQDYVASLARRSRRISAGFVVLALAWSVAGAGLIYNSANPDPPKPTVVKIERN